MANKTVVVKMSVLPNVAGRVDYISNPKRQENLFAFYQTPADPERFWKDLSEVSRDRANYHKGAKIAEAREQIVSLPNDLMNEDHEALACLLAETFKAKYGVECAVGIHLNKAKTNYHAHVVFSERYLLEDQKVSIAGRNTYFDADGKRSTKGKCVGADGQLLPGCRLVKKGEAFPVKRFSGKDNFFASKTFCHGEKLRYADLFNEISLDQWTVYNHQTNPHMRLMNLKRGEPEGLRAWKERENAKIRRYNAAIEQLMSEGELTMEQALKVKQALYAIRADERQKRTAQREEWQRWFAEAPERREAYAKQRQQEWEKLHYNSLGMRRTLLETVVILGLTIAGVDVLKVDVDENLLVRPPTRSLKATVDPKLQVMVDQICVAAGRKSPSELAAERKVRQLDDNSSRKQALTELIGAADARRAEQQKGPDPPNRQQDPQL